MAAASNIVRIAILENRLPPASTCHQMLRWMAEAERSAIEAACGRLATHYNIAAEQKNFPIIKVQ